MRKITTYIMCAATAWLAFGAFAELNAEEGAARTVRPPEEMPLLEPAAPAEKPAQVEQAHQKKQPEKLEHLEQPAEAPRQSWKSRQREMAQQEKGQVVVNSQQAVSAASSAQSGQEPQGVNAPVYVQGATTVVAEEIFYLKKTEPKLVILDVRRAEDFAQGHLDGAVNVLSTQLTAERLAELVPASALKDVPVLVYCSHSQCTRAAKAAAVAVAAGYRKVFYYYGGVEDWVAAGNALSQPE